MHYKFCLVCLPFFCFNLQCHVRLRWIFWNHWEISHCIYKIISVIWLVKPSALTACCGYIYMKQVGFVLSMSQSGLQTCPMPPACCCPLDTSIYVQLEILFCDDGLGHLQRCLWCENYEVMRHGMAWACCWKLDCQLPSEGPGSSQFEEDRCNYPHLRADNEMTSFPMPPWFSFRESIITANKTQVYLNCDVNKITAWAGTASGTEAVWVTQMPQTVTENPQFGFISGQAVAQQPRPILWEQQGQAGCSFS